MLRTDGCCAIMRNLQGDFGQVVEHTKTRERRDRFSRSDRNPLGLEEGGVGIATDATGDNDWYSSCLALSERESERSD